MDNVIRFIFGLFGNATALFLFLSPVITFRRIVKNRSTEQFSGIPYVMTLLNCLLSACFVPVKPDNMTLLPVFILIVSVEAVREYGLPFITANNILVSTINGTGAAIEVIYVLTFIVFAPKKEKAKIGLLFASVIAVFAVVALVSVLALHDNGRKLFCGFAAAIFSIVMYGSPLSIMRIVVKTKSVEFMPFFLSLFVFLCGTSWFVYGLLGHDPFVAVPNGFGCALGALQLILYSIYRDNKGGDAKKQRASVEDKMELGLEKPHQLKEANNVNGV